MTATNDPAMRYVVALEAINQEVARMTAERIQEEDKESPSPAILEYLKSRISSLALLKQYLTRKDIAAIDAIISGSLISVKGTVNA